MKSVLLLCLVSAMLASQASHPGVKARIQEKMINQGFSHYSGIITDAVAGQVAQLEGISISKQALLIKATLTLNTLTINKIDFTSTRSVRVDIQQDNTVAFTLVDIPLDVSIAYDLQFNFIKKSQSINVKATIASMSVWIKTTKDAQGCLSFDLPDLYGVITKLDYELEEGDVLAKAIAFLGKPIFQGLIEDAINDSWDDIKGAIQPALDQAADLLKQYYTLQIPNTNFVVDLHVISLSNKYDEISFALNGTVFNSLHHSQIPLTPTPIIDYQTDYPLSVQLSDYTTNSLLFTLYDLGMLQVDATSDMMPAESPLKLDTDSLEIYFPGIVKTFGSQNMTIHCEINEVPQAQFQNSNLNGKSNAFCNWRVNSKYGYILAFTQQMTIELNLNVSVKTNSTGTYLQPYLDSLSFTSLKYLNVHKGLNINTSTSKKQFNIMAMFTAKIINGQDLWINLPIPDYIHIQDSNILFQEGSIESGVLPTWYLLQLMAAWSA